MCFVFHRWCILAPLYSSVHTTSSLSQQLNGIANGLTNGLTNGVKKEPNTTEVKVKEEPLELGSTKPRKSDSKVTESPLYSQLHLALLKSLADSSCSTGTQVSHGPLSRSGFN